MNKFKQICEKFWKAKRLDFLIWSCDNRDEITSIVFPRVRYPNRFVNEKFMRCLERE
ncbi:hypothetical protein DICPUDRAFT_150127 [Dictyostelium purpureum]|uniref:Uncharacterized protein n=1 Tax=Dictyostelium purpureum TaxID=5786 RepID=F0ZFI4_DICPU|nr:uncharacterized protein DICPUDRAFT_150127 [Dictyostelium purpureum]EGC37285.1 hypothetical protein DICPUDRAFT_150127 [Dictyostelium purpureum]|eukprot:XP_003286173.1 hypothetical protein DICPUDRAFT_150127 [Dictyostelium purpureum]